MRRLFCLWGSLSLLLFSCQTQESDVIRVATAANMRPVMDSLIRVYETQSEARIEASVASSGTLTAQIMAGAPFDVFVSADSLYPAHLVEAELGESPRVYAYGKLILASFREGLQPDLTRLHEPDHHPISLANPVTAPYGRAAKEVLVNLTYFSSLEKGLIRAESISQTNQFLQTGAVACGFTSQSLIHMLPKGASFTYAFVPDSLYSPIAQSAVLLSKEKGIHPQARAFFQFLFSSEAGAVLESFGYQLPSRP